MPLHNSKYGENFVGNQAFLIMRNVLGYALGLVERRCWKVGGADHKLLSDKKIPPKPGASGEDIPDKNLPF